MVSGRIKALSLYKNILRAHDRFLPSAMKQLGDAYVKAEVRAFCFFLFIIGTRLIMNYELCFALSRYHGKIAQYHITGFQRVGKREHAKL